MKQVQTKNVEHFLILVIFAIMPKNIMRKNEEEEEEEEK